MKKPVLLGAHMSTSGGAHLAIDRGLSIGCTAVQIFVKNNMQWFASALKPEEAAAFTGHPRRGELAIFGHTGYLINLAAIDPELHAKSTRSLTEELVRADQLEIPFLVLHPGSHMKAGVEAGIEKIAATLDAIFASLPEGKSKVALEITAGQGTGIGHTFEQLAAIIAATRASDRLVVCLDTAHLFAAGYDISTADGFKKTFAAFERVIGMERLAAVHCNDSKTALGSRVDRHEAIGKGKIGVEPFRHLMSQKRFALVPKVLETPKGDDLKEDVENMALLRSLIAAK